MPNSTSFQALLNTSNYIAGNFYDSGKGLISVMDKFSQELIAELPLADQDQVEIALESAREAAAIFRSWTGPQRRKYLEAVYQLLQNHAETMTHLIVAEAGKPLSYAKGEVSRCLRTIQLAIEEISRFTGETVNVDYDAGEGRTAYTSRVPVGPVACISPFNFPLNLALHKIAPALATGCPVILKPSPYAPLSALSFAALCHEAGYPPGFISVLMADIPEAELIVTDPRTKLFSFTGSPQVGWMLKQKAAQKRVILELGGNAATIIEETADLDLAARRCAIGSYLYAGQICISTQRIYVQDSIAEDFKERLLKEISLLQVGDPHKGETLVGPLIDSVHLQRIHEWVQEAIDAGAKLLCGGEILDAQHNLYPPTLLENVPLNQKLIQEEVFGPVAVLDHFSDIDEAIQKVNDTRFGLQAGLFTNRLDHVQKAHVEIEVAGLIVNDIPGFRVDGMPYGGVKDSGLGREGIKYAMEDMTEPRLLVLNRLPS